MSRWKLATIDELISVYDFSTGKSEINPLNRGWYWSSTPVPHREKYIWVMTASREYVPLTYGRRDEKLLPMCVKTVRGVARYLSIYRKPMKYSGAVNFCERLNSVRGFVELIMRSKSDISKKIDELMIYIEETTGVDITDDIAADVTGILTSDLYQKAKTREIVALIKKIKDKNV